MVDGRTAWDPAGEFAEEPITEPVELLLEEYLDAQERDSKVTISAFLAGRSGIDFELRASFLHRVAALGMVEDALDVMGRTPVLAVGERLDRFEILGLVGRGGMGSVYRARDGRDGSTVALKVLPHDLVHDPRALQRFRQEAALAASIEHPHLVHVHELVAASDHVFLVMDYVVGRTLRQVFADGDVDDERRVEIAVTIARAVAAAHHAGMVHRDLKPENVMLDADLVPRVLDFGLAKRMTSFDATAMTLSGQVVGTVGYMSPEQALGRPIGPRTDQFSLAAMLFEWLSGQAPFARRSPFATVDAILNYPPHRLRRAKGWRRRVESVLLRALEKRPEDRYDDLDAFANDLLRALTNRRPRGGRSPARIRANRRRAVLIALFLATSLAGLKVVFDRLRERPVGAIDPRQVGALFPILPLDLAERDLRLEQEINSALSTIFRARRESRTMLRIIDYQNFRAPGAVAADDDVTRGAWWEHAARLGAELGVYPSYRLRDGDLFLRLELRNLGQHVGIPGQITEVSAPFPGVNREHTIGNLIRRALASLLPSRDRAAESANEEGRAGP